MNLRFIRSQVKFRDKKGRFKPVSLGNEFSIH